MNIDKTNGTKLREIQVGTAEGTKPVKVLPAPRNQYTECETNYGDLVKNLMYTHTEREVPDGKDILITEELEKIHGREMAKTEGYKDQRSKRGAHGRRKEESCNTHERTNGAPFVQQSRKRHHRV